MIKRTVHITLFACMLLCMPGSTLNAAAASQPTQDFSVVEQARISFHPVTVVRDNEYTLGDIASIDCDNAEAGEILSSFVLGRSPGLGSRYTLHPRQIQLSLARMGLKDNVTYSAPDRITVEREVQDLDLGSLETAVIEALYAEVDCPPERIVVENMHLPQSVRLPGGEVSYDVSFRMPLRGVGTAGFTIDTSVDGESARQLSGSLRMDVLVEVLESARTLRRGDRVSMDAVRVALKPLSMMRGDPVSIEDVAAGLNARRALVAGNTLTWMQVETEKLVERGDRVRLLVERGSLTISTVGVARGAGALGETVDVVNATSGKRLRGVIEERSLVRVIF